MTGSDEVWAPTRSGFVRALLPYGARVDDRYGGATPLHYAAKPGFTGAMKGSP
jgi:hypothetical protein